MMKPIKPYILIFLPTALVLSAMFYFSVFKNIQNKQNLLSQKLSILLEEINKREGLIQKEEKLAPVYKPYFESLKQQNNDDETMSALLSYIEKMASAYRFNIVSLTPNKVVYTEPLNYFRINLTCESSFIDTLEFIHKLQDAPFNFRVNHLDIGKKTNQKEKSMDVQIVLEKIYFRSNPS